MDALRATARTSGGAAGGFKGCFPAVPAVETPKEPPWGALTPEECVQLLGHGCWDPLGSAGCVSVVLYKSTQCSCAGVGVKVNYKFAALSLLEFGKFGISVATVTACLFFFQSAAN